jgi:hypothetical protein
LPAGETALPLAIIDIHQYRYLDHQHQNTIASINDQVEALGRNFEAVIAACELPVPRDKLKNRIKTFLFLGNPRCRGVDELCTTNQLESRRLLFAELEEMKDDLMASNSHNLRLVSRLSETHRLEVGNRRLEALERDMLAGTCLREQQESVLMHYNELQSRAAEVEAMAMNFQKMVADAVAPSQRLDLGRNRARNEAAPAALQKRRLIKATHSEWTSEEIRVEKETLVISNGAAAEAEERRET